MAAARARVPCGTTRLGRGTLQAAFGWSSRWLACGELSKTREPTLTEWRRSPSLTVRGLLRAPRLRLSVPTRYEFVPGRRCCVAAARPTVPPRLRQLVVVPATTRRPARKTTFSTKSCRVFTTDGVAAVRRRSCRVRRGRPSSPTRSSAVATPHLATLIVVGTA